MYVCVCMYVCMYVCMNARMNVCMYVFMYEYMYVCMYVQRVDQNFVVTGVNDHRLSRDMQFTLDTQFPFAADLRVKVPLHAELCTLVSTLEPPDRF